MKSNYQAVEIVNVYESLANLLMAHEHYAEARQILKLWKSKVRKAQLSLDYYLTLFEWVQQNLPSSGCAEANEIIDGLQRHIKS